MTVSKPTPRTLGLAAGLAALALTAGAIAFWPDSTAPAGHAGHNDGEAPHKEGFVAVTPEQIAASQITLAKADAGSAATRVFPATVASSPSGSARIDARAAGVVLTIAKSLGDSVRKGEVLARIESAEAAGLASQVHAAQARVTELSANAARERRLYDAKVTARQDLEGAEANLAVARAELQRARSAAQAAGVAGDGRSLAVISPIAGRITAAPAVLGSFVSAGTELYRVVDPAAIRIEVAVPASDAGAIAAGDTATLILPDKRELAGQVRSITPALNPESRSATALVTLAGPATDLQPGAFLQARIRPSAAINTDHIAVPEDAVQTVEGRDVVFRRVKGGFEAVPVRSGERAGGMVTILSGLAPGTMIATTNAFLLKAELGKEGAEHAH